LFFHIHTPYYILYIVIVKGSAAIISGF